MEGSNIVLWFWLVSCVGSWLTLAAAASFSILLIITDCRRALPVVGVVVVLGFCLSMLAAWVFIGLGF
jgi:hypothetical protein